MAGIIKATGALRSGKDVQSVAFNFDDMSDKAQNYLGQVEQRAAGIVARARRQADQIRRQAEQQGLQAAIQAARKGLEQRLETLLPALDEAIRSIHQARDGWLTHWEKNAVRLAAAIAERVIRRELEQSPDIPLELIREALELAAGSGRLTIRLNPRDYETLGDQTDQLVERIARLAPAEVVADPEIQPGGCRVDTQFGAIDQQIQSQLARIEEELS